MQRPVQISTMPHCEFNTCSAAGRRWHVKSMIAKSFASNLVQSSTCQHQSGCDHHNRAGYGDYQINVYTCHECEGEASTHSNHGNTALNGDANSKCCAGVEEDNLIQGAILTLASMASLSVSRSGSTVFHSKYPPDVSITKYVARMQRYLHCKASCYVLCVYYIDKLLMLFPKMSFDILSSHRLIMTSIVLAAKFSSDTPFSDLFYSRVGGVSVQELNSLENCFLNMLDGNLTISEEQYSKYSTMLSVASCVTGGAK